MGFSSYYEEHISRTILCGGYEQSQRFGVIQDWKSFEDDKGSVITDKDYSLANKIDELL